MRIAIPANGSNLNSTISPRFGRSPKYLITDTENGDTEAVSNPAAEAARGAGVAAAQIIASKNVEAVGVVFIGPNAYQALSAADIKVYQVKENSKADKIAEEIKEGQAEQMSQPTGPPRQGRGLAQRGGQQGQGKNRGQGRSGK